MGMGSELYATCPAFRQTVDLCVSICEGHGFPPFLDIITNRDADISSKDTIQTQLAVATLEVSLAAFWRSCGVKPSMVMGHSLGEYAALQVSGVLSLADMLYLVGHRARLLVERCEAGACAMLAVQESAADVQDVLDKRPHSTCAVACTNSPSATVISGSTDDVTELRAALKSTSKMLAVPYGFHSFQMDPILDDYIALAGGVTYSEPKIPVASTLLASIVETSGVFDGLYLGRQTRQAVDFVGALNAINDNLADPVWLEIGPSQVCGSFIRATISPALGKIMSTLEASTNPWISVSKCLAGVFKNGIDIDWVAFHAPFTGSLKLLNLPTYAWDTKDFWITYTESNGQALAPADVLGAKISTCAQYVVEKSLSPKMQITLRASLADPGFTALLDGHRIRGVSICPGSVFCEAGLAAAKYALQYSGRKDDANGKLAIRNVSLKRPLTRDLVGSEGELLTTVVAENSTSDSLQILWKSSSANNSYDMGSCVVTVCDAQSLQADWDRMSYFVRARMNELIKIVKNGYGHRMLPGILYALFANTVEYHPDFKCIKEAFISSNFEEGVAEVVLPIHPNGSQFYSSPYWGESLVHLAGFLVNANPDRPGANTTFMMDSFDSFEQTVDLEPGQAYLTYVRVSQRDKNNTCCDVYVFDSEKLVMQCSALRFHEVSNDVLDRLLGKSTPRPESSLKAQQQIPAAPKSSPTSLLEPHKIVSKAVETIVSRSESKTTSDTGIFNIIMESIAKGTGTTPSELTDDMQLVELGEWDFLFSSLCTSHKLL